MTTVKQVLNYAASQIGTRENPMGSNNTKYNVWYYGMNNAPWCAMFVSYCFYNQGLPLPAKTSKGFAYCGHGIQWFKNKGWWHTTPKVGDVVFYDWHNGGDPNDHVGIVEKVNANGSIVAIEGNYKNRVQRVPRSGNIIIGYGRPPYDNGGDDDGTLAPPWPRYIALTSPYMEGNDILRWQKQMIHRGWDLDADSVFDEHDEKVLKQFQQQKGLENDGVIGPISWNAAWTFPITPD